MELKKYKLADIAKIEISGVDKKTIEGENYHIAIPASNLSDYKAVRGMAILYFLGIICHILPI